MYGVYCSEYKNCFKYVGAFIVCVQLAKISRFIIRKGYYSLKEKCGFGFNWKGFGKWAIVTGGTDGIGKAYAEELALRGFSICLISRNFEKLNSVATLIEEKYDVLTKTINADFTGGPETYSHIKTELETLDGGIGVLVNNVGMSYKYCEYFHAVPDGAKFMADLIHSNVTSCTMMMKIVMPKMENKGVIINISSLMGIYPMPLLATYAACKAYVDNVSRALQLEYQDKGFIIQCVLPGYVATKMSNRRTRLEVPSAKTYVASAMKTVGSEDCTYGYLAHKVRGFVHEWLKANMPACVNLAISMHFMRNSRDSYFRKLKRKEQEKSQKNTDTSK